MTSYANARTSPFASLWLVWQGRRVPLVYLGAVCSWLMLLFGAFAQQALQVPLREVIDGAGSIPRGDIYLAGKGTEITTTGLTNDGGYNTIGITAPPDAMREAITNALFIERQPFGRRWHVSNGKLLMGSSDHQVVWLGASDTSGGYAYADLATLAEFYVIYLPDPSVILRKESYSTRNLTANLKAFKGTLSFGLSTLHTSIQSGITTTTETDPLTDLDWQETEQTAGGVSYQAISTTAPGGSEVFWFERISRRHLKQYFSNLIFTGNGRYVREYMATGRISYSTDGARAVGESFYTNGGMEGLTKRLDILARVLAPARRLEPYFEIAWGWLALPIATVVLTLVLLTSTIFLTISPEVKDKMGDLRTNVEMDRQLRRFGGMKT
ncbi:MAG: hypothetical protein Q9208_008376 [Pyrenodesmia sp. 3 TL-2023]